MAKDLKGRKDVDLFINRYESYISDSTKYRTRVARPFNANCYRPSDAIDYVDVYSHEEPLVEIHMPRKSFSRLVERDEYYTELERNRGYNEMIVNKLRADERVRDDNPAVQQAYMKYLMLLELARK